MVENKKGQSTLHIIIGILLITGGLLYLFEQPVAGAFSAGLGIFIELGINLIRSLK